MGKSGSSSALKGRQAGGSRASGHAGWGKRAAAAWLREVRGKTASACRQQRNKHGPLLFPCSSAECVRCRACDAAQQRCGPHAADKGFPGRVPLSRLVQPVSGEGVSCAQQPVEVVRPHIIANEGVDGNPEIGLDPEALAQRLAPLRCGLQKRRQQHAGQRGDGAQRVVTPRAQALRIREWVRKGCLPVCLGAPGARATTGE